MSKELSFFQSFIYEALPRYQQADGGVLPDFDTVCAQVQKAGKDARSDIFAHTKKKKHAEGLHTYIRQHQAEIILLADELLIYIDATGDENERGLRELSRVCHATLEGLLGCLRNYCNGYFNPDVKLPELKRRAASAELKEKLETLSAVLIRKGACRKMMGIALETVYEFADPEEPGYCSYRRLDWLNMLTKELGKVAGKEQFWKDDIDKELLKLLANLNLNSFLFYNYCIDYCKKELKQTQMPAFEKLSWIKKAVGQIQHPPGIVLRIDRPPLKDQILAWLKEELPYQQQLAKTEQEAPQPAVASSFRLMVLIPLAQLAFLLRLLVDLKLVKVERVTEFMNFIAGHCVNEQGKPIDARTLRTRYYETDSFTANGVRELLMSMVRLSKQKVV